MAEVFDAMAPNYDVEFSDSPIGKLQRNIVHRYLEKNGLHDQSKKILELNSGTGVDAEYLLNLGHTVTATDASEGMISVLHSKLDLNKCRVLQLDIREIKKLGHEKFDLVFSNFGGMNCIGPNETNEFFKNAAQLLNPHGRLILVYMSSCCFMEQLYFLAKLKPLKAFRRFNKSGIDYEEGESTLRIHYYSPFTILRYAQNFDLISKRPVGLFIPPSYMNDYFSARQNRLKRLAGLDNKLSYFGFSSFADHFLIDLKLR